MYTTSRTELITALLERDDAVDAIDIMIVDECMGSERAFVQWRAVGRFDNVAFLDDDVLIEPSHRSVESAGVFVFTFVGSLVSRIECYHDALSLLEQMLPDDDTPPLPPSSPGGTSRGDASFPGHQQRT